MSHKENHTFKTGFALLIGVGADLPGSARDARSLYQLLIDPEIAAYPVDQVRLLTNSEASRDNILRALDHLIDQTKEHPEATVIILYSGHGGQYPSGAKESQPDYYLLPNDYIQNRRKESLLAGSLFTDKINAISTKKLLAVFDCCHAEGVAATKDLIALDPSFHNSNTYLLHRLSLGKGRIVIASSKTDEVSWETNGQGLFMAAFLEALQGCNTPNGKDYVHVLDILHYAMAVVPERSKKLGKIQNPVINKVVHLDPEFFVCRFREKLANTVKSGLQLTPSEIQKLDKIPSNLRVNNFSKVQKQINIQNNHGSIKM